MLYQVIILICVLILVTFFLKKKRTKFSEDTLLIFSEGKSYWGTFRPILNELIKQKISFRYITLDRNDPALKIESEYMESQAYSKGLVGFARLSTASSPLMLATTPNIGSEGYPVKKSADVKELVHVFHALSGTSNYKLGGLDFYDTVIMAGSHQEDQLRIIEQVRDIKAKELIALGLPYLDDLRSQITDTNVPRRDDHKTVLVAPSWGSKGCFSEYGTDFVLKLAEAGYKVIIRLHPQSYVTEPEKVEDWKKNTAGILNIKWDNAAFGTEAMMVSDLLVSDTSSIRFDYAFLFSKPVITLDIPKENRGDFESIYLEKPWAEEASSKLGVVVDKESVHNLNKIVEDTLEKFPMDEIIKFRDDSVANFGCSAPAIVKFISKRLKLSV